MMPRIEDLSMNDENIPMFYTPHKEKKMLYMIMFSYKAGIALRDTSQLFVFEGDRHPYSHYEEATARARKLAEERTDKKIYVAQLLNISEFIPPVPASPVVTTMIS